MLLISLFLFSLVHAQGDKTPPVKVHVQKIALSQVIPELKYPGTVIPRAQGKLTSEVSGTIVSVRKTLGAKVGAREAVLFVRQNQEGLQYNDYAVRSPISGVLSQMDYSMGQYLQAGVSAGTVIDPKKMKISVEAPAQDMGRLKSGLKADFQLEEDTIALQVKGVAPVVNPTTGTSLVELEPVRENHPALRPGSVGKITIYLPAETGMAIPARAVMNMGSDTYVRLIDASSKVHFIKVQIGNLIRNLQLIKSGLKVGDEIITDSSGHIKEGDSVMRITEPAPPAS